MTPARWPRPDPLAERLLVIDTDDAPREALPGARLHDAHVGDLPALLRSGDVLVVNDAATLPASLAGRGPAGGAIEVRLAGAAADDTFWAALLGPGDWRTPTERRAPPEPVRPGDLLTLAGGLSARVERASPLSPRLVALRFDREGAALWTALYRAGRPVQYAYLRAPLHLFHVQTRYGARPWAAEMPSAGRPLTWDLLLRLRRRGVALANLTHGAGLSSTGDPAIDAALPLPERYEIPAETVAAVARARRAGGRVIAVGTSVVRALEGCLARHGALVPGAGETDLRIGAGFRPRVVDGLLTGMHEPAASHFDLLRAFVPGPLLEAGHAHASAAGYLCHEFGDSSLALPRRAHIGPVDATVTHIAA